jgi:hypothetical protein
MTNPAALASPLRADLASTLPLASWVLRAGAALCFIGHGAFGFLTKAAWLPYFGLVGIPADLAWRLMPTVGAVDVLAGMAVLFAPRRLPLLYMVVWGTWTALLRPLAGESVWEAVERAGNYGVPLALLLLAGPVPPLSRSRLLEIVDPVWDGAAARAVLRWTTCLLLAGHGMLGIAGKPLLTAHYAAVGLPASTTAAVGWLELALALTVAVRPGSGLLLLVAGWKLATESLFLVAGAPIWEVVERAGSYAAPLALAVLLTWGSTAAPSGAPGGQGDAALRQRPRKVT